MLLLIQGLFHSFSVEEGVGGGGMGVKLDLVSSFHFPFSSFGRGGADRQTHVLIVPLAIWPKTCYKIDGACSQKGAGSSACKWCKKTSDSLA